MHEPDQEEDEEMEDPEVDEQIDTGVQMTPPRPEDDEAAEEIPHNEEPDVPGDEEF